MSSQAVIPLEETSATLTAGEADNIVFLIAAGDYIYGITSSTPAKPIKIKKTDLTDRTVVTFANDGLHGGAAGLVYSSANDRIYVLFSGSDVVIAEVNPSTLARTDKVTVVDASVSAGADCLATDGTYLYVLWEVSGASRVVRYELANFNNTLSAGPGVLGQSLHYSDGFLYVVKESPSLQLLQINASTLATATSGNFPAGALQAGVDLVSVTSLYVFATFREDTRKVYRFAKSGPAATAIATLPDAEHLVLESDSNYIWDLTDNGQVTRIEQTSLQQNVFALSTDYLRTMAGDGSYLFGATLQASTVVYRFLLPRATSGSTLWVHVFGGAGDDYANAVAVDANGNAVVVGSEGGVIAVKKISGSGNLLWAQSYGSGAALGVVCDSGGNIYVTGYFLGSANFGGGTITGAGPGDAFVLKLNSNGVHQWSKGFVGPGEDHGKAIAIDTSSNVYVTGFFTGTINFGGGGLTALGGCDVFLVKLNSSGTHQWSKRFGTSDAGQNDIGYGVACDTSGNVYLCGQILGPIDFGGGAHTTRGYDAFLVKFNSSGTYQWSKVFGSALLDFAYCVAADPVTGDVVIGGSFYQTINFGGSDIQSHGNTDTFVAKFNSVGTHQWSRGFGNQVPDPCRGVAIDRSGNVYITGRYALSMDCGNGVVLPEAPNDIYAIKIAGSGGTIWGKSFGGVSTDQGNGIACDQSGNVYIAGQWYGAVDFGDGIVRHSTRTPGGMYTGDACLLKLAG